MTDEKIVSALGQGINLVALRTSLPALEAACNRKLEASEDFREAIAAAAQVVGIIPSVLSQYITARCNDTVNKKAHSAQQLSLLFSEL